MATYVQSGNVVFQGCPKRRLWIFPEKIEKMVLRRFGQSVPVIVRTAEELDDVVKNNPFLKQTGVDPASCTLDSLSGIPQNAGGERVGRHCGRMRTGFAAAGREILSLLSQRSWRNQAIDQAFEKMLSVGATTRNWNTVNQLHQMTAGESK